jgi:hypothetical protein
LPPDWMTAFICFPRSLARCRKVLRDRGNLPEQRASWQSFRRTYDETPKDLR